jgi:hypothetical protein
MWGYWGNSGCVDTDVAFDGEESRSEPIGEDGGGEERVDWPGGKASGELKSMATTSPSSFSDDATTRSMAFFMIRVTSSSVRRSSTNTLKYMSAEKTT